MIIQPMILGEGLPPRLPGENPRGGFAGRPPPTPGSPRVCGDLRPTFSGSGEDAAWRVRFCGLEDAPEHLRETYWRGIRGSRE